MSLLSIIGAGAVGLKGLKSYKQAKEDLAFLKDKEAQLMEMVTFYEDNRYGKEESAYMSQRTGGGVEFVDSDELEIVVRLSIQFWRRGGMLTSLISNIKNQETLYIYAYPYVSIKNKTKNKTFYIGGIETKFNVFGYPLGTFTQDEKSEETKLLATTKVPYYLYLSNAIEIKPGETQLFVMPHGASYFVDEEASTDDNIVMITEKVQKMLMAPGQMLINTNGGKDFKPGKMTDPLTGKETGEYYTNFKDAFNAVIQYILEATKVDVTVFWAEKDGAKKDTFDMYEMGLLNMPAQLNVLGFADKEPGLYTLWKDFEILEHQEAWDAILEKFS